MPRFQRPQASAHHVECSTRDASHSRSSRAWSGLSSPWRQADRSPLAGAQDDHEGQRPSRHSGRDPPATPAGVIQAVLRRVSARTRPEPRSFQTPPSSSHGERPEPSSPRTPRAVVIPSAARDLMAVDPAQTASSHGDWESRPSPFGRFATPALAPIRAASGSPAEPHAPASQTTLEDRLRPPGRCA